MFRSLHMKLVMIMVLLIVSLMAVVGTFLINSTVRFYVNDFYEQINRVTGENSLLASVLQVEGSNETAPQTYDPSHYAIEAAAAQDYGMFYQREMSFRKLLRYPPFTEMLCVRFQSEKEEAVIRASEEAAEYLKPFAEEKGVELIGPCNPSLYKVNDNYRKILYMKHPSHDIIIGMRELLRNHLQQGPFARDVLLGFDLEI